MVSALVRAYCVVLSFYPKTFRHRYADEMRLDFEDALQEAVAAGAIAALLFACRQTADMCSSLLREWSRGTRAATAAATTVMTVAIWGLALRPWAWKRTIQLRDRGTFTTAPVDVWDLLVIAIVVMVPVIVVIVLAPRLVHYRKLKP
jgi:uncharacterized membrane protein YidH (DUF202 family)